MSIVRENIMNDFFYTPYCGKDKCPSKWPRTTYNGNQFVCDCGWSSSFEKSFIEEYNKKRKLVLSGYEKTK